MIDFDERDVPADVRARITDTVHRGLAQPTRRGLRTPLAAAASVAVLLVAGLVAALVLHDRPKDVPARPTPAPTPSHAVAPDPAKDEVDRCWAAVVAAGKQNKFPARAKWATVQRQPSTSANVTALRGDGKTFFCMTTKATVTVTDPTAHVTAVAGTPIRVALADDNGWVLGTTTAAHPDVTVTVDGTGAGVEATGGVFLIHVDARRDLASHATVQVGDGEQPVPPVPAPAVERADRPLPAPDRTSPAGKVLGQCLDRAGWPKSYADQWQPMGYISIDDVYAETAESAGQLGVCVHANDRYRFTPVDPLPASATPQLLSQGASVPFPGSDTHSMFVMGTVPAAAKTMTLILEDGNAKATNVRDGVWVAAIPAADPPKSVVVKDAAGRTLYTGPLVEVGGK